MVEATRSQGPRVIVGVRDRVGDVPLLHRAAAEARRRHAVLVPVLAWTPVGGEALFRTHPSRQLEHAWEHNACVELDELVTDAFGPEEPVRVHPVVVRAQTLRDAVAAVAVSEGDVVFPDPPRPSLWERLGVRHHGSQHHRVALAG
ncbi:hypothetical protein [Streptacidiphilus jiangxiensis]|uniref:Universal stress protein family protein n=1 Tax=Streptacidiphilus jiangxiensis TaxID=235985 RepID=A0A1H7MRX7_STRJI|nr:hypothetical protein [Streptacidiphilus jiangxiensis]SEL13841.1 hypothetical protein SAMN05414137_10626 [Streptacidiphilus jiangxiensis]